MRGDFPALVALAKRGWKQGLSAENLTGGALWIALRGSCSARAPQDEVLALHPRHKSNPLQPHRRSLNPKASSMA
jgi:uncharacterized protein (DUF1501 family)